MYNPEIGSSQHASSMNNPSTPENSLFFGKVKTAKGIHRGNRKCDAIWFRRGYIYGDSFDQKTCIWSGDTFSWQDKSSGIMWVGVHGMDTVCVVTMTGDVDMAHVSGGGGLGLCSKHAVLSEFRKTVISEIEDLGSTLYQRFDKSIEKPFGVVSVIPHTNEVHKESGYKASSDDYVVTKAMELLLEKFRSIQPPNGGYDGKFEKIKGDLVISTLKGSSSFAVYDEEKAIKFLQEKMKSNMHLTVNETIQIAISAFQHLLRRKFKANEIEVSIMDPYYKAYGREDALFERTGVKVLEIIDMAEHLAIINGPAIINEPSIHPWEQKHIPVAEAEAEADPKAEDLAVINRPSILRKQKLTLATEARELLAWKQRLPQPRGLAIIFED